MKTLILIAVFICAFAMASFAQESATDSISTKDKNSLKWETTSLLTDSSGVALMPYSDSLFAEWYGKKPITMQKRTLFKYDNRNQANNTMPCYRPGGNYRMPVAVPDSTKNYTLLIVK